MLPINLFVRTAVWDQTGGPLSPVLFFQMEQNSGRYLFPQRVLVELCLLDDILVIQKKKSLAHLCFQVPLGRSQVGDESNYHFHHHHFRAAELEGTLWIVMSSPSQGGTVGN